MEGYLVLYRSINIYLLYDNGTNGLLELYETLQKYKINIEILLEVKLIGLQTYNKYNKIKTSNNCYYIIQKVV